MTHTMAMLRTEPRTFDLEPQMLAEAIERLVDCANTCTQCADACLSEPNATDLAACIRLNLDCADVCEAASHVLSRQAPEGDAFAPMLLEACAEVCEACARTCAGHADMEHCRICAEQCEACAQTCRELHAAMQ